MPGGEVILVAYGEENIVLTENPQITFFKIIYRRYTNFSIETIQNNFLYQTKFGKRYSVEISKIGDLINKMWLVIDLPEIPVVYNYDNTVDTRLKFKWTKKLAYAIIDFIEIEIGGQIISKLWGEWMNVLEELNWNNFNGSLDEYIGNTPDLTTYKYLSSNFKSKILYVPLFFWFCNNSGSSLPLLCLEYNIVRLNIQINDFQSCGIFSPSSYISLQNYYGNGILGEPLIQYSQQGISWAEFDSVEIGTYDATNLNITSFNLYFRRISDNQFITSSNFAIDVINFLNGNNSYYLIYGLYSGSIFIPTFSANNDANSIYLEKNYLNYIDNLVFKNMYLLCNYIYLDRDERTKFYQNKHEYIVEQIYYSNPLYLINLNNRNTIEIINPCKYFVFMAQVKYFLNYNVNYLFNYNLYFFDIKSIKQNLKNLKNILINKNVMKNVYYSFNTNQGVEEFDISVYDTLYPFYYFPKSKNNSGYAISSFSLYPDDLQPSGSCNMSYFNSFEINTTFNPIDIDYNKYVFKCYVVTYNYLRIANGVAATIFNSYL